MLPPRARRHEALAGEQADRVALSRDEMRERRGRDHRVAEFCEWLPRKIHRPARVEHDRRRHVRRLAKLLGVDAVGSRDELPVDVFQIVAGPIVPVLAELGAVAVERAAMQARTRALRRRCGRRARGRRCRRKPRAEQRGGSTSIQVSSLTQRSRSGDGFEQAGDDLIGVDAVGLCLESSAGCGGAAPAARRRGCPRATRRCGR